MKIGVGLPSPIPGVTSDQIKTWAKYAEDLGFSSLSTIDRIGYPLYEPLVALSYAAGATERIRLVTSILLAPLRPTALLIKQVVSLSALSKGRLTLGLGIGGRPDDFNLVEVDFSRRLSRLALFVKQLNALYREKSGALARVIPTEGFNYVPEVLLGGFVPNAARRAGKIADGFVASPGSPLETIYDLYRLALDEFAKSGRKGAFRLVVCKYFALPPHVEDGKRYIIDYYSFMPDQGRGSAERVLTTLEQIADFVNKCAEIGADETIMWPTCPDLGQLEQLVEILKPHRG